MNQLRLSFVILLFFTLVGCSGVDEKVKEYPGDLANFTQQTSEFTKEDAVAIFYEQHDVKNYEITDLILVNDEKIPELKAVISYFDKIENNSSNLAFIYEDISFRVGFAVNEEEGIRSFENVEDSQLTYIGDGTVTTSIRNVKTNEILDYKITFSRDDSIPKTHFIVDSEERQAANQVSSVVVEERQNDEYILIKEIILLEEIKTVIELLENTKWEENIKVTMAGEPDYRFTLDSINYAIWITPNGNRLEVIPEGQAKYTKLPIEDSIILFKILTGRELSR